MCQVRCQWSAEEIWLIVLERRGQSHLLWIDYMYMLYDAAIISSLPSLEPSKHM